MKNFYLKVPGLIRRSLLIFSVTFLLVVSFVTAWLWWNIPVDKSALPLVPARIVLLTREGVPFAAAGPRMRAPVAVEDLPPYVAQAFYAIEDRRFEYHFGVDPVGIGRALLNNLSGGGQQGGSTITQQLAKNVYLIDPDTGAPYPGYSRIVSAPDHGDDFAVGTHRHQRDISTKRRLIPDNILCGYLQLAVQGGSDPVLDIALADARPRLIHHPVRKVETCSQWRLNSYVQLCNLRQVVGTIRQIACILHGFTDT